MDKETLLKLMRYIIPGATFILGLLVRYYFDLFKNKIAKLRYEINKSFLGASGHDYYFGKVQVLYNDRPVQNLYLCTINLVNSSNKDFKDVEITVWCDVDSIILVSNAQKYGSIEPLKFTSQYLQQCQNVTERNKTLVWTRRIYHIPVLNRDDNITFSCLVTNSKGREPGVFLNCDQQGLKIEPTFVKPQLFWGERQDISALWGLIICALFIAPVVYFTPSKILVAIMVFIMGAFCIIPGVLIVKLSRKIKSLLR